MPDREKILHELDHQVADADWCNNDWKDNVPIWMLRGALALLREQEAVKPKKGLWLHPTYLDCCCSVCGMQPEHEPGEPVPLYPYCPDCGAKMEVKWDER